MKLNMKSKMKSNIVIKIRIIGVCLLWMSSVLSLNACSFFYGEQPGSSYNEMFDSMWNDYNETYALFEVRGVDWAAQYNIYKPRISESMTDKEFFDECASMLYTLSDSHVYIKTPFGSMNSGEDRAQPDAFSLNEVCSQYISSPTKCGNGIITYGTLRTDSTVGYIHIASFSSGQTGINQKQDWASDIDIALEELKDTKCIILDVRGNRGGLTGNVSRISGRFCAQNKVYAISHTKNGKGQNDFDDGIELEIKKNGSRQYTKPVLLLTNAQTMSAGEEFSMAMTTQPHVTQIGNHTCGVFSLALERCLCNGWRYSVSVQKVTAPDGNTPEGMGIVPSQENLILNTTAQDDRQMQRALAIAQGIH